MSYKISEECINCGAVSGMPQRSDLRRRRITKSAADHIALAQDFTIAPEKCTECIHS
jgi:hypothetical protein